MEAIQAPRAEEGAGATAGGAGRRHEQVEQRNHRLIVPDSPVSAAYGRLTGTIDQFEDHVLDEAMKAASGVGVVRNEISVAYELPAGGPCPYVGDNQIVKCVAAVTVPYTYSAATPIIGNIIGELTLEGASRFPVSILCDAATCPYGS